jgi:outer membrane lipoprotein-sorting protein
MRFIDEHPRSRWVAPAAAVVLIGAASFAATRASADPTLPPRSAQQLLTDIQKAEVTGLSGTVVQTANLGLPEIPGLSGGGQGSGGSSDLSSMVTGTHTLRVWYGGPDKVRLALVGTLGESDVIRNGSDLWVWSSKQKTAVHRTLPEGRKLQTLRPEQLPMTPDQAAKQALRLLDPTTEVTSDGTATVAGRDAYELVLTPRSSTTLVKDVRIAVDAAEHVPLRVQVDSTKVANPAIEVGFTQVDFSQPEARQFEFDPPPGTTVTEGDKGPGADNAPHNGSRPGQDAKPTVVGKGWDSVVVATLPDGTLGSGQGDGGRQLRQLLRSLPEVSGDWGSGHLLSGTLFSAVLTDDGRVAVGAVPPERLYAALSGS